ncbi:hypothetical protein I3W98_37495, partial [Streptomyces cavourensis]|nr:hypothetical protein [Streptomyces cavourensis]
MSDDERGGERAPGGECAREALAERLRELREGPYSAHGPIRGRSLASYSV